MNHLRQLSILILVMVAGQAAGQISDAAFTINGEKILRQKVQSQVDHLINERGLGSGGITQPAVYKQMQQEVIEQLVVQELLWQEARRREVVVQDAIVDSRLAEIRQGFETEQAFVFKIEAGGFTPDSFRETIRQQMSVQQMIQRDIAPKIVPAGGEIKDFYSVNLEQMRKPVEVHARHILIRPADANEASMTAARKEAEAILAEIHSGSDFEALATERSDAPSAPAGGDLGFFREGQMVPPFERAAFALEPGEVSNVVLTQFGFHIIKVETRRGGDVASVEEVSEKIRAYLAQQKLQAEVEALVTRLRDASNVEMFL